MAGRIQNILILQKSKSLPLKLRETLRLQGYASTTVFDVETALTSLKGTPYSILLVDCGESHQAASQTIKRLVDTPDICDYPMVVIAPSPDAFQEAFDRYFMFVNPVETPCGIVRIMEVIRETEAAFPEYLKRLAKVAPDKLAEICPSQALLQIPPQQADIPLIHPAYAAARSMPDLLFSVLQGLPLQNITMNGHLYGRQLGEEELIETGSFPEDEELRSSARAVCRELAKKDRLHLYRTAFILGQSAEALKFPKDLRDQCAGAAFLFAQAFSPDRTNLLRVNYIAPYNAQLRQEIASVIRESSQNADQLGFAEIGEIIGKLALLIDHAEHLADDNQSVAASGIMAADLMDRICYHGGHWNPTASYLFLTKTKDGTLNEIHPKILSCLIKFLIESITAKRPAFLVPKHIRRDQALKAAAASARKIRPRRGEKSVEISALAPGMKLARPLLGYDGSVLLSSDLVLDSDLIWRLWQLASIKIINTPVIIENTDVR